MRGENSAMLTFVLWVLGSLVLAAVVFLVANVMERREGQDDEAPGLGRFLRDFRSGLRRKRVAPPAPVETGMDEFFAATIEDAPGYVDPEELTEALHRARLQARSSWHVGSVRKPE